MHDRPSHDAASPGPKRESRDTAAGPDREANPVWDRLALRPAVVTGVGERVQFQSDSEGSADAQPQSIPAPWGIIVEDGAEVGPGQSAKLEFLGEVAELLYPIVEEALAPYGQTYADCPYVSHWLGYYANQSPAHIERAIARYASPEKPVSASWLKRAIVERVQRAVQAWAGSNGEVLDTPDGVEWLGSDDGIGDTETAPPELMSKLNDGSGGVISSSDPAAVQARLGDGQALEGSVRARMEQGFGESFADVRLHTDRGAAGLASGFSARAFTVGHDVAFAAGQYRPGTVAGDVLIAHELAHVVQQRGGGRASGPASDVLEDNADLAAVAAVGRTADGLELDPEMFALPQLSRGGLRLQRCNDTTPAPDLKQEKIKELKAEKARLEAITATGSGKSLGEVGGATASLKDVTHDLAVLETGTGTFEGNRCTTTTVGATRSDCTEITLEILREAFAHQGRGADWKKVEKKARKNMKLRKATTISGIDYQAALQSELGWKGVYWAPDPTFLIPQDELAGRDTGIKPEEASFSYTKAKSGSYYKGFVSKKYPGVKVAHTVVNYAPEPGSTTVKDTSSLDKLRKIPFGLLSAHGGFHMAIISYGKVVELHWKEAATSVEVITQTDLGSWAVGPSSGFHYFASGVIVAPAEDVDNAFK